MNKYMRSFVPYHSPLDPCPPIGKKYYSTPPNLFLGFQPPNLPQFTPKSTPKGTLWPVFMTIMKILIKRAVTTDVNQSLPEEYYQLLLELQELDFVLVELTLYLDTHPDDTAAINQFNDFSYKRSIKTKDGRKIRTTPTVWKQLFECPLGMEQRSLAMANIKERNYVDL